MIREATHEVAESDWDHLQEINLVGLRHPWRPRRPYALVGFIRTLALDLPRNGPG